MILFKHIFIENGIFKKDEALQFLAKKTFDLDISESYEGVYDSYLKREAMVSTGMLDGFAIPHAIDQSIKDVSILVLKTPQKLHDWETLDDSAVEFIISILVPEQQSNKHLEMLQSISRVLIDKDSRDLLITQNNIEGIYNTFVKLEGMIK